MECSAGADKENTYAPLATPMPLTVPVSVSPASPRPAASSITSLTSRISTFTQSCSPLTPNPTQPPYPPPSGLTLVASKGIFCFDCDASFPCYAASKSFQTYLHMLKPDATTVSTKSKSSACSPRTCCRAVTDVPAVRVELADIEAALAKMRCSRCSVGAK
jgi:hypothetical protein